MGEDLPEDAPPSLGSGNKKGIPVKGCLLEEKEKPISFSSALLFWFLLFCLCRLCNRHIRCLQHEGTLRRRQ